MNTGMRIKALRKEKGMTQEALATASELSVISIRKYESGERNPKIETIQKIADALEVPLGDLFKEKNELGTIYDMTLFDNDDELDNVLKIIFKERGIDLEKELLAEKTVQQETEEYIYSEQLEQIIYHFNKLNKQGQIEATKRVQELTEIPKYQKKPDEEQ